MGIDLGNRYSMSRACAVVLMSEYSFLLSCHQQLEG